MVGSPKAVDWPFGLVVGLVCCLVLCVCQPTSSSYLGLPRHMGEGAVEESRLASLFLRVGWDDIPHPHM